jgi:alcohol dehydrogenase
VTVAPATEGQARCVFGEGSAGRAAGLLRRLGVRSVLLVTGRASFDHSGAAAALGPALEGLDVARFDGVRPNPTIEAVRAAVAALRAAPRDCVLGVGGGSALDVAKAAAALAPQPGDPLDYVLGGRAVERPRAARLVLVPTTAGSGSEATRFAAVYVDGHKRSLDHPALRCDAALVDPLLAASQPAGVAASTALDALSQSVESYWSPRSTARSRSLAGRALRLLAASLPWPAGGASPAARRRVALAAHLSGLAIDVTRTTAAHALAYPLTARFGVPHGHACALHLSWLLPYNAATSDADVADGRGAAFVRARVAELLALLEVASAEAGGTWVLGLVQALGLSPRLDGLGVTEADLPLVVAEGLASERAANNPRRLTPEAAAGFLRSLLEGAP